MEIPFDSTWDPMTSTVDCTLQIIITHLSYMCVNVQMDGSLREHFIVLLKMRHIIFDSGLDPCGA